MKGVINMFYRRKSYLVYPEIVDSFNEHFNQTLLPAQLKYGSRLVGRWMRTNEDDTVEIFAIWEYDSYEAYEAIEQKVRSDEAHLKRVQQWYAKHGGRDSVLKNYIIEMKNERIESTVV